MGQPEKTKTTNGMYRGNRRDPDKVQKILTRLEKKSSPI